MTEKKIKKIFSKGETHSAAAYYLEEELKYEKLRTAIWQVANNKNLSIKQWISQTLKLIGETMRVSRAGFFRKTGTQKGNEQWTIWGQWTAPGISKTPGVKLPKKYIKYYRHKNCIEIPADIIPVIRIYAQKILKKYNVKNYLLVPVGPVRERTGMFTLTECRQKNRQWTTREKNMLIEIANILAYVLDEKENDLKQKKEIQDQLLFEEIKSLLSGINIKNKNKYFTQSLQKIAQLFQVKRVSLIEKGSQSCLRLIAGYGIKQRYFKQQAVAGNMAPLVKNVLESGNGIVVNSKEDVYEFNRSSEIFRIKLKRKTDREQFSFKPLFVCKPLGSEPYKKILAVLNLSEKQDEQGWDPVLLDRVSDVLGNALAKLRAEENTRKYTEKIKAQKKEMEKILQEMEKQQQEIIAASRFKETSSLASGAAHDFNNILSILYGLLDIAHMILAGKKQLKQKDITKLRQYIEKCYNALERAKPLTRRLLTISKSDTLKQEAFYVPAFIKETIAPFKTQLRSMGIKFKIINKSAPEYIKSNKQSLGNVLTNLIFNARDALLEKQQSDREKEIKADYCIAVCFSRKGNKLFIKVYDNGPGIDTKIIDSVFDPFFTTKKQTEEKGTGLGLSMVKRIVQTHNGHVNIKNNVKLPLAASIKPARGLCFTVSLPAVIKKKHITARKKLTIDIDCKDAVIWIADDEKNILSSFLDIFALMQLNNIKTFTDGEKLIKAFKNCRRNCPDLIIADMQMPGMDGMTVVRKIKKLSRDKPPAVIICTASSAAEIAPSFKKEGVGNILEKPFTISGLVAEVNKALAG
ncbi:MAG TPA: ATP-binding protein [Spirochaetota bacterium]|nr:ATP-binding protein [Spirochaetota bacterium]